MMNIEIYELCYILIINFSFLLTECTKTLSLIGYLILHGLDVSSRDIPLIDCVKTVSSKVVAI